MSVIAISAAFGPIFLVVALGVVLIWEHFTSEYVGELPEGETPFWDVVPVED